MKRLLLAALLVAGLATPAAATCYIEPYVNVPPRGDEPPAGFHVYCGPPPTARR